MQTVFDLLLYVTTFGSLAVLFASILGLAFWLLRAAWRGATSRLGLR